MGRRLRVTLGAIAVAIYTAARLYPEEAWLIGKIIVLGMLETFLIWVFFRLVRRN